VNDITFQPVTQNVILSGSYSIIDHFINPSEVDYYRYLPEVAAGTRKPEFFPSAEGLGQPHQADGAISPHILRHIHLARV
jgi:hypothetical protein